MKSAKERPFCFGFVSILLVSVLICGGCGQITEKDNIRIARMDGKYITRGELFKLLREMDDKDRPKIRNKGDLLRVLNQYIDDRIKIPLGKELATENKISVPRESAREQFFRQSGDDEEQLRSIWQMEVPEGGKTTPLMDVYNLTPASLQAMKSVVETGTDKALRKMLGEQAVAYLAMEDFKAGKLTLNEDDLKREYDLRANEFKKLEWMRFAAVRFPTDSADALAQAAQVRARIDAGENFDDIYKEYAEKSREERGLPYIIQSEIENNPNLARFRGFWQAASGAEPGTIIGPMYLPQYQQIVQDAQGRTATVNMPDAYLVLKVLEIHPETAFSLEEARMLLAPSLLVAEKMKQLRAEHGVEIYENKLPDPSLFRDPTMDYSTAF